MQCDTHWNFFVPCFPHKFLYFLTCSHEGSLLGPHSELLHSPGMQELCFLITETSLYFGQFAVTSSLPPFLSPQQTTPFNAIGCGTNSDLEGVRNGTDEQWKYSRRISLDPCISTGLQEQPEMPFHQPCIIPSFIHLELLVSWKLLCVNVKFFLTAAAHRLFLAGKRWSYNEWRTGLWWKKMPNSSSVPSSCVPS